MMEGVLCDFCVLPVSERVARTLCSDHCPAKYREGIQSGHDHGDKLMYCVQKVVQGRYGTLYSYTEQVVVI